MSSEIDTLVDRLELESRGDAGYFRVIYNSHFEVDMSHSHGGVRNSASSIHALLRSGDVLKLHSLKSDELWYYHAGSPCAVFDFDLKKSTITKHLVGFPLHTDASPFIRVPAGHVLGAFVPTGPYALVSCVVTPGFNPADDVAVDVERLREVFPNDHELISKLS